MAVGEPGWLPPDEHCTAVGDAAAAALNADALAAQAPTLEDGSNGPPTCTVDHGGDPDTGALPGAATG